MKYFINLFLHSRRYGLSPTLLLSAHTLSPLSPILHPFSEHIHGCRYCPQVPPRVILLGDIVSVEASEVRHYSLVMEKYYKTLTLVTDVSRTFCAVHPLI